MIEWPCNFFIQYVCLYETFYIIASHYWNHPTMDEFNAHPKMIIRIIQLWMTSMRIIFTQKMIIRIIQPWMNINAHYFDPKKWFLESWMNINHVILIQKMIFRIIQLWMYINARYFMIFGIIQPWMNINACYLIQEMIIEIIQVWIESLRSLHRERCDEIIQNANICL